MSGRSFYTPLRYPGGKGKFSSFIKALFELNNLCDGHYAEPYAGGAGVALELLFLEYASTIHINDIDPAVYAFWWSCVNQTDELCKKIYDTPVTVENWRKEKKVMELPAAECSKVDLGFAAFYLNRTNRSGILKAGVIGGKEQSGKWKLDARFNKSDLIQRIQKIGKFAKYINVYNRDAVDFLNEMNSALPNKSLVYLDPPYYVKGSGLYRNYYEHSDHEKIKKTVSRLDKPWLVSYDNVEQIRHIYRTFPQIDYELSYTAQDKRRGSEVMIFPENLKIPRDAKLMSKLAG